MDKVKNYTKIIIFTFSIFGFIDLLINPKGIEFLNSDLNKITSLLTIICLTILTSKEILKYRLKISLKILNGIKILILTLFLIYLDFFLKKFNFIQNIEFIIVAYHTLPIVFILNDLLTKKIVPKYLTILGTTLIIPTLIYFCCIYKPYEAYWN